MDGAAEHGHDLLDDPEPEPDAAEVPARSGALEPTEDAVVVARGDPEPAIPDHEPRLASHGAHGDIDWFPVAVLDGVRDQVA
ncbi:MAG TPA: hypothetical protein VI456_16895, partial [Polyangia bacterium]